MLDTFTAPTTGIVNTEPEAMTAEAFEAWITAVVIPTRPDLADELRARWNPKHVTSYTVRFAPPGSILMANGSRAHRTATLRATVTGQDGEHLITVGDFQILRCSCDDEPDFPYGKSCAHLEAYRCYI